MAGALRQRWAVWAANEVEFDEQAGQPDMPISYAVSVSVCVSICDCVCVCALALFTLPHPLCYTRLARLPFLVLLSLLVSFFGLFCNLFILLVAPHCCPTAWQTSRQLQSASKAAPTDMPRPIAGAAHSKLLGVIGAAFCGLALQFVGVDKRLCCRRRRRHA